MKQGAKQWFKPLARAGYASRGLVYAVIGFFAALAGFGAGQPMDTQGALEALLSSQAGGVLAYALVAGLAFYSLWRLIQAGFDTDSHGKSLKGLAIRGGLLASALVYLTLAFYTFSLMRGAAEGSDGGGFAEGLASFVGSRWAAALLAAALTAVGVAHLAKALREKYTEHVEAGARAMRFIHPIAKTGLIARGGVFLIIAFLFALRAWREDGMGQPPDSRQALEYIQSLPAGGWLLAATGIGLIAFAFYSFIEAVFRRINVEDA